MKQGIKKHLLIYFTVLVVLALIQHPDLLIHPIDRISHLPSAVAYGMGAFHPFIFALIGYGIVMFFTFIFSLIKKIFTV
jgi:hypothetical protein